MAYKKEGKSATQIEFSNYVQNVTNCWIENCSFSYITQESVRNTWRYKAPYSDEMAEKLILFTKTYLRTLSSTNSNNTNPQFLQALINLMADYLSRYTMRAPNCPDRKVAKQALFDELYTNSHFINHLRNKCAIRAIQRQQNTVITLARNRHINQK